MEYYDKLFREFLNETGSVNIAGTDFLRDVILKTLDESLYDEAYLEWLNQRKNELIDKADDVLSQFEQFDRFNKIKLIHAKGVLIPFIGAGLSIPSSYPGWTDFLFKLLKETDIEENKFNNIINTGNYEEAAQLLFDNLPSGSFLEQVENIFGTEREISGVIQRLPEIFQRSVITTNFDNLIDRCYSDSSFSFNEIILGKDALALPRYLADGKSILLKLHGLANNSNRRVLTKNEYDQHYKNSKELVNVIEALSQNSLLFLGCSLTVDRTIKCLNELVKRKGHENMPRHYAFLKLDDPDIRIARQRELALANIYPIWYTEDHNECIEALLEKLSDGVSS